MSSDGKQQIIVAAATDLAQLSSTLTVARPPQLFNTSALQRYISTITQFLGRVGLKNKWLHNQVNVLSHYINEELCDPLYIAWFLISAAAVHLKFKSHYVDLFKKPGYFWDTFIMQKSEVVFHKDCRQHDGMYHFLTDKSKNRMNRYYSFFTRSQTMYPAHFAVRINHGFSDSDSDKAMLVESEDIVLYYFVYECKGYPPTTVYFTLYGMLPQRDNQNNTYNILGPHITLTAYGRDKKFFECLCKEAISKNEIKELSNEGFWLYKYKFDPAPLNGLLAGGIPKRLGQWVKEPAEKKDNLVLDYNRVNLLSKSVKEFLGSKADYKRQQIPYRKGYLLYGPPGTGKTSIVKYLATVHKMNLCEVKLSDMHYTSDNLSTLMKTAPPNSILLMDDIDACGIDMSSRDDKDNSATKKDKEERITLSALLGVLDGVDSYEDNLLFMTTNHVEKLSKALIRDGRIDYRMEVPLASLDQIYRYFIQFFPEETKLAALFCKKLPPKSVPMVTLQKHFSHYTNYSIRKENELIRKIDKLETKFIIVSYAEGFFGQDEKLPSVSEESVEKMDKLWREEGNEEEKGSKGNKSKDQTEDWNKGDRIYYLHDDGVKYPGRIEKVIETKDGYEFNISFSRYNINGVYERIENNSNSLTDINCIKFRKRSNKNIILQKVNDVLAISINGKVIIEKSTDEFLQLRDAIEEIKTPTEDVNNNNNNLLQYFLPFVASSLKGLMFPFRTLTAFVSQKQISDIESAKKTNENTSSLGHKWTYTADANLILKNDEIMQRKMAGDNGNKVEETRVISRKKDLSDICVTCYLAQLALDEVSNIYVEIQNNNLNDCSIEEFLQTLGLEQYASLFRHYEVTLGRNLREAKFDQLVKANLTLQYDKESLARFLKLRMGHYYSWSRDYQSADNVMEMARREEIRKLFFKAYPPPTNKTTQLPDPRPSHEPTLMTTGQFEYSEDYKIVNKSPRGLLSRENSLTSSSTISTSESPEAVANVQPTAGGGSAQRGTALSQHLEQMRISSPLTSSSSTSLSSLISAKNKKFPGLIYTENLSYENTELKLNELFEAVSSENGIIRMSRYQLQELLSAHPGRPKECVKAAKDFVKIARKPVNMEDSDIDLSTFLKRAGNLHAHETLKKHFNSALEMREILVKFKYEIDYSDLSMYEDRRYFSPALGNGIGLNGNNINSNAVPNNQDTAKITEAIFGLDNIKFECLQNFPDLIEILTRKPPPKLKLKDFSLFSVAQVISKFTTFYSRVTEDPEPELDILDAQTSSYTVDESVTKFPSFQVEAAAYTFAKSISDHKLVSTVSLIEIKNYLEKFRDNPIEACLHVKKELLSVSEKAANPTNLGISHHFVSADGIDKYFLALRNKLGKSLDSEQSEQLSDYTAKASFFYRALSDCFSNLGISLYDLLMRGGVESYAIVLDHRNITTFEDLKRFGSVDIVRSKQIQDPSKRIISLLLEISARLKMFDLISGKILAQLLTLDAYGKINKREFDFLDSDEIKSDFISFYKDYATVTSSTSTTPTGGGMSVRNAMVHYQESFSKDKLSQLSEEAAGKFKCISRFVLKKLLEMHPRRPKRFVDTANISSSMSICDSFLDVCDIDIATFVSKICSGNREEVNYIVTTLKTNFEPFGKLNCLSDLEACLKPLEPEAPPQLPNPNPNPGPHHPGPHTNNPNAASQLSRPRFNSNPNPSALRRLPAPSNGLNVPNLPPLRLPSPSSTNNGDPNGAPPVLLSPPVPIPAEAPSPEVVFNNIPVELAIIIKDIVIHSEDRLEKLNFRLFANVDAIKVLQEFMKYYVDSGYIRKSTVECGAFRAWICDKIANKVDLSKYSNDLIVYLADFAIHTFDQLIGRSKASLTAAGIDSALVDVLMKEIKEVGPDDIISPVDDVKAREEIEVELEAIAYTFACAVSDSKGCSKLNMIQVHSHLDKFKSNPLEALRHIGQHICDVEKGISQLSS